MIIYPLPLKHEGCFILMYRGKKKKKCLRGMKGAGVGARGRRLRRTTIEMRERERERRYKKNRASEKQGIYKTKKRRELISHHVIQQITPLPPKKSLQLFQLRPCCCPCCNALTARSNDCNLKSLS